ncbi:unnamed protein product [Camellia sinensis]
MMLFHIPIFPNHPIMCLPSLSPLFLFAPIQQWKALPMKDLILGRWVMDASIIGEDTRLELPAATKSSIVVIVTMNPRWYVLVPIVESIWENISAKCANSTMTMYVNYCILYPLSLVSN